MESQLGLSPPSLGAALMPSHNGDGQEVHLARRLSDEFPASIRAEAQVVIQRQSIRRISSGELHDRPTLDLPVADAPTSAEAGQMAQAASVMQDAASYLTTPPAKVPEPHTLRVEQLVKILRTAVSDGNRCHEGCAGLDNMEVGRRLEAHGLNKLSPPKTPNKWVKLIKLTFGGILNMLLWFCVLAEVILCMWMKSEAPVTPLILSVVIIGTATLQWITELKAESSMEELRAMQVGEKVRVARIKPAFEGVATSQIVGIDSEGLVAGDVIFLTAGDKIPCDVRIIHCTDGTEVDNSALTGESLPEVREAEAESATLSLMEARNMAFFGTTLLKGSCTAIVVATGDRTFLGEVAASMQGPRPKSSLEIEIAHFIHLVACLAIGVGALVLVANLLSNTHREAQVVLENCATALFTQVPEGLLPTVTFSLMAASGEMFKRSVMVKKLDAIETLGCVRTFCSDKTGTLTTGSMTLMEVAVPKSDSNELEVLPLSEASSNGEAMNLCRAGALNNAAMHIDGTGLVGSPTEMAIFSGAASLLGGNSKIKDLRAKFNTVFEIPFNSENKWMLTLHPNEQEGAFACILKGATERILPHCTMDEAQKEEVYKALQRLMKQGHRVLCVAQRLVLPEEVPAGTAFAGSHFEDCNFPIDGLTFLGLFGIEDPPRPGVKEAVAKAEVAGIKVVMVTGDHPGTAQAIAYRLGITTSPTKNGDPESQELTVLEGSQLEMMVPPDGDFSVPLLDPEISRFWNTATSNTRVFARVSPLHKQIIVKAYQRSGYFCAMTGDGVNDAPALKQADVGIAMGVRGTDVAKDASDLVLLDDQFSSAMAGVEMGRLAAVNLQKSIMYTLCSKVPQVAPAFIELLGIPEALAAEHILLIDIGTDIWTAVAYAMQPAESSLMEKQPRHPRDEKLVNYRVFLYSYCYIGVLQTIFCWIMYFVATPDIHGLIQRHHALKAEDKMSPEDFQIQTHSMTVYYWTLVLGQVAAAICTTTTVQPVFGPGGYGLPNKMLNITLVLEITFSLVAMYTEFFQKTFRFASLPAYSIFLPVVALVSIVALEEARKRRAWCRCVG